MALSLSLCTRTFMARCSLFRTMRTQKRPGSPLQLRGRRRNAAATASCASSRTISPRSAWPAVTSSMLDPSPRLQFELQRAHAALGRPASWRCVPSTARRSVCSIASAPPRRGRVREGDRGHGRRPLQRRGHRPAVRSARRARSRRAAGLPRSAAVVGQHRGGTHPPASRHRAAARSRRHVRLPPQRLAHPARAPAARISSTIRRAAWLPRARRSSRPPTSSCGASPARSTNGSTARPRLAGDDFSLPLKIGVLLLARPAAPAPRRSSAARGWRGVYAGVIAFASIGLALRGRAGASAFFPLRTCLFAPLWVFERSVSVYWALLRKLRGAEADHARIVMPEHGRGTKVASSR